MKLWTKNMRTSNISGPTSNNKVLKRMAMGRKAAETHINTRLDRHIERVAEDRQPTPPTVFSCASVPQNSWHR